LLNNRFLDDISARVGEAIANGPVHDVQKNVRALLASAFSRLDLVAREELELQSQVLLRTREKLEALEARVAELEAARQARAARGK
jgi:BMFP domain-containing protein YqiC